MSENIRLSDRERAEGFQRTASDAVTSPASERTGEYRTVDGELVADEEGNSYISMEDFAIALVDELESGDGVHSYVGTGY